jgi:hypothetical protein
MPPSGNPNTMLLLHEGKVISATSELRNDIIVTSRNIRLQKKAKFG